MDTTTTTETFTCSCTDWSDNIDKLGDNDMKTFKWCPWCGLLLTSEKTLGYRCRLLKFF